jgi:hypothetical protein
MSVQYASTDGHVRTHGMATRFERLYEEDFYAWTREQAKALRRLAETRPQVEIDFRHLAEEIRDLGKERRDALRGRATRVIEHLPLLEHSAARDPRRCSGVGGIVDFRRDIEERLTKTLRRDLARQLPRLYSQARRGLVRKLAAFSEPEAAAALPAECPYTLDQVLGDWWPEEGELA